MTEELAHKIHGSMELIRLQAGKPIEAKSEAINVLYVDCIPTCGYTLLDKFIAPLCDRAAKLFSVKHYSAVDYGKGKAAICEMLVEYMEKNPLPGHLVCSSGHPFAGTLVEILAPKYSMIVTCTKW